jgi:hypothetical protein
MHKQLLFLLFAVLAFQALAAPLIKSVAYRAALEFGSLDCDAWVNEFSTNGVVYLPGGAQGPETYSGKSQIASYCAKMKLLLAGAGTTPIIIFFTPSRSVST